MVPTYLLLGVLLRPVFSEDWCRLGEKEVKGWKLCQDPSQHIYCRFPNRGPSPNCPELVSVTNSRFRTQFLDLHNDFRNKWANGEWPGQTSKGYPKAANMMALKWDSELEAMAQRNADNCIYEHEGCMALKRFMYGQNLAFSTNTDRSNVDNDIALGFPDWVGEFVDFDSNLVERFHDYQGGAVVFHFTQAVWATTYLIGCAQVIYRDGDMHKKLVTCDYAPGGNNDNSMYIVGEPTTKCPPGSRAGYNVRYNYLCGLVGHTSASSHLCECRLLGIITALSLLNFIN